MNNFRGGTEIIHCLNRQAIIYSDDLKLCANSVEYNCDVALCDSEAFGDLLYLG